MKLELESTLGDARDLLAALVADVDTSPPDRIRAGPS
jgi:hypothetical protein